MRISFVLRNEKCEKMLALMKPQHHVIALDVKGALWSTEQLAKNLAHWQQDGRNIDLLIGGLKA